MHRLSLFGDLIKYKLSLAVVLSAITGFFMAGFTDFEALIFMASGVFFLSSSAAVLNQYSERNTDILMERTRNRPIPSGKITTNQALFIFLVLLTAGIFCLAQNGIKPVLLGTLCIVLYNILYTRLKRISILAIIPGGFVGAIPPLIGYVSTGNNIFSPEIIFFSVFMFLWQVPHFWLLIIRYGEEYSKAGLASISFYLDKTQLRKVVFYWVLFSNATFLAFFIVTGLFGLIFTITYLIVNVVFIFSFFRTLFNEGGKDRLNTSVVLINSYGLIIMIMLTLVSVI